MDQQAFKEWYTQGLQALVSANDIGEKTIQNLTQYVTSPNLKAAIEQGQQATRHHGETITRLLQDASGQRGENTNEIMAGIDKAAGQIAESRDNDVRDAGVITTMQIILHYHIAAYGNLAATAKRLGMNDQAAQFSKLIDEAKQADTAYTQIAEKEVTPQAQAA